MKFRSVLVLIFLLSACEDNQPLPLVERTPLSHSLPSPSIPATVQNNTNHSILEHVNSRQFQEAIWIADENNQTEVRDQIVADLEQRIQKDSYEQSDVRLGGIGLRAILQFQSGFRGIFKPDDYGPYNRGSSQNPALYGSEIAAYKLDRLLELNLVPMTVPFTLTTSAAGIPAGTQGSLQVMVDTGGLRMEIGRAINPLSVQLGARNFQAMEILDYISGNTDRTNVFNNDNWIYWPSERRVIAIDHGIAFQDRQGGCFVRGTNSLYWGFKDPIRASIGGNGRLNIDCRLDHLRENGAAAGQLLPGILDEVNLGNLSSRIRDKIRNLTYDEFHRVLSPYVSNRSSCVINRNNIIPSPAFNTTGCLDLAWNRLLRLRQAIVDQSL